jgi:NAD(P)-dependent dehydrogenase (short-subunit alcohol dehydrogenase family)
MEQQLLNGHNMILITGASKGIGDFLFKQFLDDGEIVSGTFNSTKPDNHYKDFLYKIDITDFDSVNTWINSLETDLKNIVLLNCASLSYNQFAHKSDIQRWKKVIEVNLIGTFNVIRCLLPFMRDQGYGRIINFSSVAAQIPTPGVSAYAASKSALWGLTKSLAVENGSKGITINNINLGYANIGMGINDVPEEFQRQIKQKIPSGVFCDTQSILKTVKFLIDTEYINGASIDLNGGMI